jgi:CheY-like chemotaxis protein
MKALQSRYILVLDSQSEDTERLQLLLKHLRCPCIVVSSADQCVDVATKAAPYLVLVGGDQHTWSPGLVAQLRRIKGICHSTILALTDHHAPSWLLQEENPGFDGFLVKPLNGDILTSVVESAQVRHNYFLIAQTL